MAYELIETIEVGSGGAASIEFTSIPQDGVDLLVAFSGRSDSTNANVLFRLKLNGSTANWNRIMLRGSGSAASSLSNADNLVGNVNGDGSTASTFGSCQIMISNYAGSSNKSISVESVQETNASAAYQYLTAAQWADTSAITSLTIYQSGDNWMQYSTASLYKIY